MWRTMLPTTDNVKEVTESARAIEKVRRRAKAPNASPCGGHDQAPARLSGIKAGVSAALGNSERA
jgi:hypothetical protein